ncbi:Calx-beta domain-containing protein [Thalassoroseus pseudoceratinae]|uniref:Calx-beta domain-containing protein n=1 Tax=Thalassoroseus pseudoceratinae TaxID=2713176 RepID=UPI001422A758|nr:Calx-beta domain-containing protein [Thalassoroseus pseudoceratinae]
MPWMFWLRNLYTRWIPQDRRARSPRMLGKNRRRPRFPLAASVEALETRAMLSATPVGLTSGETVMASISTIGEEDCYTINAAAGEDLLLTIGEADGYQLEVALYAPDGTELQTVSENFGFRLDQKDLPQTGTYTYVVREVNGDDVGDYSLTAVLVDEVADADNTVMASGTTYDSSIAIGDIDTFTIDATAGEDLLLTIGEADGYQLEVALYAPNGTELQTVSANSGFRVDQKDLPQTGTYTYVVREVDGDDDGNYSLTAVLVDEVADADNTAMASGTTYDSSIAPGDIDTYTIDASVGEDLLFTIGENFGYQLEVALYAPDGTELQTVSENFGFRLDQKDLPQTGTYTYVVREINGDDVGDYSLTVVLVDEVADADNTVMVSGTTYDSSIAIGDIDTFTIDATAGEDLLLTIGESDGYQLEVALYAPDGTELQTVSADSGFRVDQKDLPQTGTYTYVVREVDGDDDGNYSLTVVLVDEVADADNTVMASGTTYNSSIAIGDIDTFTIDATAGEDLLLTIGESNGYQLEVSLYAPDGTDLQTVSENFGFRLDQKDLPQTGIYTYVVREVNGDDVGDYSLTAVLVDEVADADDVALVSGATYDSSIVNGDIDTFTIDAVEGGVLLLSIDERDGYQLEVTLYAPDGTELRSVSENSRFRLDQRNLSLTGTYTYVVREVDGDDDGEYTLTAVAVDDTPEPDLVELTSGLTVDGTLERTDIDTFTIDASAGDDLLFSAIGSSASGTLGGIDLEVSLYAPDGKLHQTVVPRINFNGVRLDQFNLSQTGTYTYVVRNSREDLAGSYSLTAVVVDQTVDADNVALVSGDPVRRTVAAGDIDTFTINASAGEDLLLTRIAEDSASQFRLDVTLYAPDGAHLRTFTASDNRNGFNFNQPNLPQTGVYTYVVRERNANFISDYTLQLDKAINTNDATLSIDDVTQDEAAGVMRFTVSLSQAVGSDVSFDYFTTTRTADSSDFGFVNQTETIPAGATSTTVLVNITDDVTEEIDERFFLNLANVQSGAFDVAIGDGQGVGTILDDDAPSLTVNDVELEEDDGPIVFTISLNQPLDEDLEVDFTVTDEGPIFGGGGGAGGFGGGASLFSFSGFSQTSTGNVVASGTAVILAGNLSTQVTAPLALDNVVAFKREFRVKLENPDAGNIDVGFSKDEGVATVINVETALVSIDDITQDEDAGTMIFTVSQTLPADVDVFFDVTPRNEGTDEADFTATPLRLSIPAGNTTATFTVDVAADNVVELDERFFVDITNLDPSGRAVTLGDSEGVGTIRNDDTATISVGNLTQNENAGPMTFLISLDSPVDVATTVQYATATNTADSSDFTSRSGSVTIPAGSLSVPVTVPVSADNTVELDERFLMNLSNPNASGRAVGLGLAQASGNLNNDDAAVLTINDVIQIEDAGVITFTVSMSRPVDAAVSFDYTTLTDSADANDFTPQSDRITIPAGSQSATISIPVTMDNTTDEGAEQFFVELTNLANAGRDVSFGDTRGTGTIIGDNGEGVMARVSIDDVTQNEDAGTIAFTVSLDAPISVPVHVEFTTATDSADASDFTVQTGTITIPANSTSATLVVNVDADMVVERDEQFFVNLSNIQPQTLGVLFADNQGVGTIVNDDVARLNIDSVSGYEGSDGTRPFVFTVTSDLAVDRSFTVDFTSFNDPAVPGDPANAADLSFQNGTLTFAGTAGETQTITIDVNGDTQPEGDEAFFVDLANVQAGGRKVVTSMGRGRGDILNDDLAGSDAVILDQGINNGAINGNYQKIVSGSFDGIEIMADDLFFWDPRSGANRIVYGHGNIQTNPIEPGALNGNDFTEVIVGNFNDGRQTELFFWNPRTGRNRLVHLSNGIVEGAIETNVIPSTAINGNDFTTVVAGNFNGDATTDLFFWNPVSGRNRIAHFQTVQVGLDSDVVNLQTNVITPTIINGSFQSVHVGNFVAGGLDELLFLNLQSGANRLVSLETITPGVTTGLESFQSNMLPPSAFNGSAYDRVSIGDLNGDGLDDVFAWGMRSGANRVALTNLTPGNAPNIVSNVMPPSLINGEFEHIVKLTEDVFSSPDSDEFFFWNPRTGRNRVGYINAT